MRAPVETGSKRRRDPRRHPRSARIPHRTCRRSPRRSRGADAVARTCDHTLWRDDLTEIADRLGWLSVVADMSAGLESTAACTALGGGRPRAAGRDGRLEPLPRGRRPQRRHRSRGTGAARARHRPIRRPSPASAVSCLRRPDAARRRVQVGFDPRDPQPPRAAWERHPDPPGSRPSPTRKRPRRAGGRPGLRRHLREPADIGGRYSALSYFGLVPAAGRGRRRRAARPRPPACPTGCGRRRPPTRRPASPRRWPRRAQRPRQGD